MRRVVYSMRFLEPGLYIWVNFTKDKRKAHENIRHCPNSLKNTRSLKSAPEQAHATDALCFARATNSTDKNDLDETLLSCQTIQSRVAGCLLETDDEIRRCRGAEELRLLRVNKL